MNENSSKTASVLGGRWASRVLLVVLVLAWLAFWWAGGKVLAPFDIVTNLMAPWRGEELAPAV
jgi:hypothetical protein